MGTRLIIWKIYPNDDDCGHGQRHVVHGHHQHAHGPIFKKNRTNLDTLAWYTGRLAIGVFDDVAPGGPIEVLEVHGEATLPPLLKDYFWAAFARPLYIGASVELVGDQCGGFVFCAFAALALPHRDPGLMRSG